MFRDKAVVFFPCFVLHFKLVSIGGLGSRVFVVYFCVGIKHAISYCSVIQAYQLLPTKIQLFIFIYGCIRC